MNALSKGVSLGIYKEGKQKTIEAVHGGNQPYVQLMGRRMYENFSYPRNADAQPRIPTVRYTEPRPNNGARF